MSHPADVTVLPKGQRSRPAADKLTSNGVDGPPALDQQSRSVIADNVAQKDNISAVTDKLKGVDLSVPGGSGLSVADKAAMNADGYLDEDSDDEMLIDLDKEAASRLRSVIILLIPMMLEKEVSSVIETVKALIKRATSLKASSLMLPILRDPAIAFVSTGGSREDWICTQAGCGKAKGKSFMSAADHITVAAYLQQLEKPGAATKASLDRMNLSVIRKEYGL
ncbi:unnamed protein product [Closterium sp. Naga37s-1]|nr:unnamed protein product [Closterium sp. Naga37s-1]